MREAIVAPLLRSGGLEELDGQGNGVLCQHPPSAAHGDDRFGPEQSPDADEDAVATPLAQLGEPCLAAEFPATDHPPVMGDQYFEDSPLLSALMREGLSITARSRSGAGHEQTVFGGRFTNVRRV